MRLYLTLVRWRYQLPITKLKERFLSRIPLLAYKHPLSVLLIVMFMTIIAGYGAKKLTLDADLNALLPDTFTSVQDLQAVKDRFGGVGYIIATIRGDNPPAMRALADEIANKTRNLEHISFIDYRRPVEFFKNRALYYLDLEDLKTIQKRIKKRWKWEKQQRNPMYVNLEDAEPPSLDFTDIQEKFNAENDSSWMEAQQTDEAYYFNEDKTFLAIFIKPNITSSNLSLSAKILDNVQRAINTIDLDAYASADTPMQVEITGRYKKKIDLQAEMKKDMRIASFLSLGLVIGYLLIHFRRLEVIVLIATPLLVGIIGTFAFAAFAFGQLNILTAFIGVILLGLGIDHGIHLLSRYRDEMKNGCKEDETIFKTFVDTGKSVAVAAFTTFVIFLGLSLSELRAFYEFGITASVGMILIMLSYLLLMPALLGILNKLTWKFEQPNHTSGTANTQKSPVNGLLTSLSHVHTRRYRAISIFSIILVLVIGFKIKDLTFNYNFESLGHSDLPSFVLDKEVNDLLGYSQTPMMALTDNLDEEYYVSEQYRKNRAELGNKSGVDFLLATGDLIPLNQEEKQKVLGKILKTVKKVKHSWLKDDEIEMLEELKTILQSKPFTYADLPVEVRQFFGNQQDAKNAEGAIMIFPSINLNDGGKVVALVNELRQVKQQSGERVPIAGESTILADILNLVFREAPKVLTISLIMVFSILWFFMKRIDYAAIALVPALFTIAFTLGLMAIFNIELNYISIIMIPILLGIGVDSGVHMVHRAVEGCHLPDIINETGTAIFGSIVTSGLGVGALLITNHPGLNSLAFIGVLGLTINLLVSIFILPALIEARISNKHLQLSRSPNAN